MKQHIILLRMTNLYDLERNRLRLYGEMLRNEQLQHKKHQQLQKEERLRQQSMELQKHIETTNRYNKQRKEELRQLNKSLHNDNLMLSTFKKSINMPHTYAQEGTNFLEGLHNYDNRRLQKIKQELYQQADDNQHQLSNSKAIQEKIHQIEKIEEARHQERIKEQQLESRRNYEQIKKKHQQNMDLYNKHKLLLQQNDHYRDQLEEFTNANHGLLDRFKRNQYMERRAQAMDNQSEIKRQMQELERRKSQDLLEYKKSVGNLEESMLKSMLVKHQRFEPRAYSYDLKNQMKEENIRKLDQKNMKKQKIEMNNIFGGVHGNERQKMIRFIDKRLGIDSYEAKARLNHSISGPQEFHDQHNPEKVNQMIQTENSEKSYYPQKPDSMTPRSNQRKLSQNKDVSEFQQPIQMQIYNSMQPIPKYQKSFRSYDVVSGRNKFYSYQ